MNGGGGWGGILTLLGPEDLGLGVHTEGLTEGKKGKGKVIGGTTLPTKGTGPQVWKKRRIQTEWRSLVNLQKQTRGGLAPQLPGGITPRSWGGGHLSGMYLGSEKIVERGGVIWTRNVNSKKAKLFPNQQGMRNGKGSRVCVR